MEQETDKLQSLVDAVCAISPVDLWQPIETAPNVRILVWDGAQVLLANDQEHGCFYTDDGDIIHEPTHWMPLPEPPQ